MVERLNAPIERVAPGSTGWPTRCQRRRSLDMPHRPQRVHDDAAPTSASGCSRSARWPRAAGGMFGNSPFAALRSTGGAPATGRAAGRRRPSPTSADAGRRPARRPRRRSSRRRSTAKKAPAKKPAAKKPATKKPRRRSAPARTKSRRPNGTAAAAVPLTVSAWRRTGSARHGPAGCCRGRRSVTSVPTLDDGGRKPRAMPWPSTGEKLPLVTHADDLAVDEHLAVGPRRAAAVGGDADAACGRRRARARPPAARDRGTRPCPTPPPSRARPAAG